MLRLFACGLGGEQPEGHFLFKERLQMCLYPLSIIEPAEIDLAGIAVAMHRTIAYGIVDPAITFLEAMKRIIGSAALTSMLLRQGRACFDKRSPLLVRCFSMWHTVLLPSPPRAPIFRDAFVSA